MLLLLVLMEVKGKLLRCWVFVTCSNYQVGFVWVPPLGIRLNSVGFLSGARACQPKQSYVPATVNITLLSLLLPPFLLSLRSGWKRQWRATYSPPPSLSPSSNCCGNVGSFFEKRISHWKGVKPRPLTRHRPRPVLSQCAPSCGKRQTSRNTNLGKPTGRRRIPVSVIFVFSK